MAATTLRFANIHSDKISRLVYRVEFKYIKLAERGLVQLIAPKGAQKATASAHSKCSLCANEFENKIELCFSASPLKGRLFQSVLCLMLRNDREERSNCSFERHFEKKYAPQNVSLSGRVCRSSGSS